MFKFCCVAKVNEYYKPSVPYVIIDLYIDNTDNVRLSVRYPNGKSRCFQGEPGEVLEFVKRIGDEILWYAHDGWAVVRTEINGQKYEGWPLMLPDGVADCIEVLLRKYSSASAPNK